MKQLFALALALWGFTSCSQESSDMNVSATGGDTVTLRLSAEVSVDNEEARAINYTLGNNAQGQLVPMPKFTDGQEVSVHTVLKSSSGTVVAKTLKWRYQLSQHKLVLKPEDGHFLDVVGFNNSAGTRWYVSGMIGGVLNGTEVSFSGTRRLHGTSGRVGDVVGSLEVPYAFGWTEVIIDTKMSGNTIDNNRSYKYGKVPASANLKFTPLGSLVAYKIGNQQTKGVYTFTPSGFVVNSNAFTDTGKFQLNTTLTRDASPIWTDDESAMSYSFAPGHEPGAIAHKATSSKTYYAWVMPNRVQPEKTVTSVTVKGKSSRPDEPGFVDYTKTWLTDYKVKASKLISGRVHELKANVTERIVLPIQSVADYNLAGGEGLTYSPLHNVVDPQPEGVLGPLRFATSHANDQSGYYNPDKIIGRYDVNYNPQTKNLQEEIKRTFKGEYFIPASPHWWGVFPYHIHRNSYSLDRFGYSRPVREFVGYGADLSLLECYASQYAGAYSEDQETKDSYLYAIRFMKPSRTLIPRGVDVTYTTDASVHVPYLLAPDDSKKCAFRYTRVGGQFHWRSPLPELYLHTKLIIDVVYLGEESSPTQVSQISNPEWWRQKESQGLVISKVFSTPGAVSLYYNNTYYGREGLGGVAGYYSSSMNAAPNSLDIFAHSAFSIGKGYTENAAVGRSVRLFKRDL